MLAARRLLDRNPLGRAVASFASLLCEPSEPPRLLPPYGALLRSLVTRQGELAATLLGSGRLDYAPLLRSNLQLIVEHSGIPRASRHSMSAGALAAASASVLEVFAANGVGVIEDGVAAARAPRTVAEVLAVPAFAAVLSALDEHAARVGRPGASPASAALASAARASSSEQAGFLAALGVRVLTWLRHVYAHVYFAPRITERSGLSTAIVAAAVQAAGDAIVSKDEAFQWDEDSGSLLHVGQALQARVGG